MDKLRKLTIEIGKFIGVIITVLLLAYGLMQMLPDDDGVMWQWEDNHSRTETIDGRECIIYEYGFSASISCNWSEEQ